MAAKILKEILAFRKTLIIILLPLIASFLPIVYKTGPAKGGFVVIVMTGYWMTEALPLPVTALLPVILFPMLGVQESDDVCRNYLKDTNFLFFGGMIMAITIENWNLHSRIALRILLLVGSEPRWLMLGFMICTSFLSMWITNTATTAMMVPIVQAVLSEILKQRAKVRKEVTLCQNMEVLTVGDIGSTNQLSLQDEASLQMITSDDVECTTTFERPISDLPSEVEEEPKEEQDDTDKEDALFDFDGLCPEDKALSKGLLLSIPYAADIGGTATVTGTGANLVATSLIDDLYGSDANLTFATWLVYCFPGMLLMLLFAWLWLQFMFIGFRGCANECRSGDTKDVGRLVIEKKYKDLGPIRWAEGAVLGHFAFLVLLWIFREPSFIPGFGGWSAIFPEPDYLSDATAAIFVSFLLFVFPAEVPNFLCCRKKDDETPRGPKRALLDWRTTQRMMAWNILFLLGGGFALADGCEKSGLSAWIGERFASLEGLPQAVIVLIITIIIAAFTEFTSNVSTASIFMPILAELAEALCFNPLYLVMPSVLACSMAFMLPVATPPNAIAFSYGQLTIPDMAKAGALMNILGVVVVNLMINTYGIVIFDTRSFPEWAARPGSHCLMDGTDGQTTPVTMYTTNATCVC